MSISAISSTTTPAYSRLQELRSDFQSIQNDLQSGNLAAAQTDFATFLDAAPLLKAALQQVSSSVQTGTTATGTTPSPTSALNALSTALQSGDLTAAQNAMTTLQQSASTAPTHHRHHHHHHFGASSGSADTATGTTATPDFQKIHGDYQSLFTAVQAGDVTSAQQALTQLQTDAPWLSAPKAPTTPATSSGTPAVT